MGWDLVARSKHRAAIEAVCRDGNTAGWNWEASQVRDLAHQERLLLGLACATLITLLLGTEAVSAERQTPARVSQRRTWAGGHSLFRQGRDRVWQRIWPRDRTTITWALEGFDHPTWSAERRAHHAPQGTGIDRAAA